MQNGDVALGRLIWFVITVVVVQSQTPLEGWPSFIAAVLLWIVAWLAARLAGNAVAQLEGKAWSLLCQLGAVFGLFLWFAPGGFVGKALIVWGVAIPLVFLSAFSRRVYDWWPWRRPGVGFAVEAAASVAIIVLMFGWGVFRPMGALMNFAAVCGLGILSLVYGWLLAERPIVLGHDARFGDEEEFRRSGMSRDL